MLDTSTYISDVTATWISCPIPYEKQHVSDFGRIDSFDMALVTITLENGLVGYGEAKAAVGSQGSCQSLVAVIENDLKPQLVGKDSRNINQLWGCLYNGPRAGYAESEGRSFHVLGRKGLWISAMSGVDLALWDLAGKRLGVPVLELLGGASKDVMKGYASGGWADVDNIGEQLISYTKHGFDAVKMRVGIMDGSVNASVARVTAAREALGSDCAIMVDAHGTFNPAEAREFCRRTAELNLRWFEEPVSSDARGAMRSVKQNATMPISMGESEFTCFDFQDLIDRDAADVLQPDMAICGGMTEGLKISALAVANQLELAPHCWGSAFSFIAGLTLSFASPAARLIEFSLGANPLLKEMVNEVIESDGGKFSPPIGSGWGLTLNQDFVTEFSK
ncbi:MAG: mandelate racemase/muconate lactonizing enzyme family protein [Sneathiella sp.]|uniref:mandelate racemase/muconate lactonizing enzyme family protein n=1 Tax=Sneathiella sp. TaxID=1964365 RepID=UPI0030038FD0